MDVVKQYYIERARSLLKHEHAIGTFYSESRDKQTGYVRRFIYKKLGFMNWITYELSADHQTIAEKSSFWVPFEKISLDELRTAIKGGDQ
ncbi:hypothetical protein PDM88_29515 [Bacillus cereus]|nr:hypothetical protein [Bacillus cereus]